MNYDLLCKYRYCFLLINKKHAQLVDTVTFTGEIVKFSYNAYFELGFISTEYIVLLKCSSKFNFQSYRN